MIIWRDVSIPIIAQSRVPRNACCRVRELLPLAVLANKGRILVQVSETRRARVRKERAWLIVVYSTVTLRCSTQRGFLARIILVENPNNNPIVLQVQKSYAISDIGYKRMNWFGLHAHLGWGHGDTEVAWTVAFSPELVHDPVGLLAPGGSPFVENEGFLHPDKDWSWSFPLVDLLVFARRLPVPGLCGPVGPHPSRVPPLLLAEEVPCLFAHLRLLWRLLNYYLAAKQNNKRKKNKVTESENYLEGPMAHTCWGPPPPWPLQWSSGRRSSLRGSRWWFLHLSGGIWSLGVGLDCLLPLVAAALKSQLPLERYEIEIEIEREIVLTRKKRGGEAKRPT